MSVCYPLHCVSLELDTIRHIVIIQKIHRGSLTFLPAPWMLLDVLSNRYEHYTWLWGISFPGISLGEDVRKYDITERVVDAGSSPPADVIG